MKLYEISGLKNRLAIAGGKYCFLDLNLELKHSRKYVNQNE